MKSLAKSKGGDLQSVSNQESQTQYSEVLAMPKALARLAMSKPPPR